MMACPPSGYEYIGQSLVPAEIGLTFPNDPPTVVSIGVFISMNPDPEANPKIYVMTAVMLITDIHHSGGERCPESGGQFMATPMTANFTGSIHNRHFMYTPGEKPKVKNADAVVAAINKIMVEIKSW